MGWSPTGWRSCLGGPAPFYFADSAVAICYGFDMLCCLTADVVAAGQSNRLFYNRLWGPAREGNRLTLKAGFNNWSHIVEEAMRWVPAIRRMPSFRLLVWFSIPAVHTSEGLHNPRPGRFCSLSCMPAGRRRRSKVCPTATGGRRMWRRQSSCLRWSSWSRTPTAASWTTTSECIHTPACSKRGGCMLMLQLSPAAADCFGTTEKAIAAGRAAALAHPTILTIAQIVIHRLQAAQLQHAARGRHHRGGHCCGAGSSLRGC